MEARDSVAGWGIVLQVEIYRVRFPMKWLNIYSSRNASSHIITPK
jgi:hypothetical protein